MWMISDATKSIAIPGTSIVSGVGPIYGYHFDGNSIYHGFVTKPRKAVSRGFTR
jgi:hypothetical protein